MSKSRVVCLLVLVAVLAYGVSRPVGAVVSSSWAGLNGPVPVCSGFSTGADLYANSAGYPFSGSFSGTGSDHIFFGVDFGSDVVVSEVSFTQALNSGDYGRELQVCYSSDGVNYFTALTGAALGVGGNVLSFGAQTGRYWLIHTMGLYQWTSVSYVALNDVPVATATATLTATAAATPTFTYTPSLTPTPWGGPTPVFPAWCPVGTAPAGEEYSQRWLTTCGCVAALPGYGTGTALPTATRTASRTPTGVYTSTPTSTGTISPTPSLTPTRTATATGTARPTVTSTSAYGGCRSFDCWQTATAVAASAGTYEPTATPRIASTAFDLATYCGGTPPTVPVLVSWVGISYISTTCLITTPYGHVASPSVTLWDWVVPSFVVDVPAISICIEGYTIPEVSFVGITIPIAVLLAFAATMAIILRQLGRI